MSHDHKKAKPVLDLWGSIASIACAIHCSLLPFVLSLGMLSGWKWLRNEWVELAFIMTSLILVSWSLIPSYRDVHHNKWPLIIAFLGFLIFGSGHYLWHEWEAYLSTIGGLMIASSHYLNWRSNKNHVGSCKV